MEWYRVAVKKQGTQMLLAGRLVTLTEFIVNPFVNRYWLVVILTALLTQTTTVHSLQSGNPISEPTAIPSSIYTQIITPFDETRADVANWSSVEIRALQVAAASAAKQCSILERTPFEGEELFSLARICTLGETWPAAYSAALRYTHLLPGSPTPAHLTDGFYLLIQSELKQQEGGLVITAIQDMSRQLPLTRTSEEVFELAIRGLGYSYPKLGARLVRIYQPLLLDCIKTNDRSRLDGATAQVHAYRNLQIMRIAGLQEEALENEQALEAAALGGDQLSALESNRVLMAAKRYNAFGHELTSTLRQKLKVKQGSSVKAEAFVLIQGKCMDCTVIAERVAALQRRLGSAAYVRIVMVEPKGVYKGALMSLDADVVSEAFGVTEFPSLVLLDAHGAIRLIEFINRGWLDPSGLAELLIRSSQGEKERASSMPQDTN